jgi:DNA adenine methylase
LNLVSVASRQRLGLHTPLRYPGGKSKLAGFFADVITESGVRDVTYVEPFAGGAGAGLSLLIGGRVERVVINDLDIAVNSFWSSLLSENEEFARLVETVPLNLNEWARQKAIYRAADDRDPLALGFAFFYLNRTNRSGVLHAGVIGGKAQAGTYRMDARFNRAELARRIRLLGRFADQIDVQFTDGRKCVKRYAVEPNTFLYVDPPYVAAGGSLYLNSFDEREHGVLAESMNANARGTWLLTYDDTQLIRDLYPERGIFDFELHYSAHRVGSARELLIVSDNLRSVIDRRRGLAA